MKKSILTITSLIAVLGLVACGTNNTDSATSDNSYTNPGDSLGGGGSIEQGDNDGVEDGGISKDSVDTSITDDGSSDYSSLEYTLVTLDDLTSDYEISADGNYVLEGSTTYWINLAKKNISIHIWLKNATFAGIFSEKKPEYVIITLIGNNVTTGTGVSTLDTDESTKGTIHVKSDLLINGTGSLSITSPSLNGIHSTGKLKIDSTNVTVNAYNHGIRGNDAVIITSSNINVTTSEKDAIQTDNEPDYADVDTYDPSTTGYIYIEDSTLTLDAGDDGISAASYLYIASGTIDIKTNGGAPTTITETSSDNADGKAIKAGTLEYELTGTSSDLATELAKGNRELSETSTNEDGTYTYLIEITDSSYYSIYIDDGDFTINSNDDAIHSNGYMYIRGGNYEIATGDDGIHADEMIQLSGGVVEINKCYEGIEAAKLQFDGGEYYIYATDDGVNAADGTTAEAYVANSNCWIVVNDGYIYVSSTGDGIDSNGAMYINGGTVYVDGPVGSDDIALDSDGGIFVNGGTLVALGSSGMVETPQTTSTQYVVSYAVNSTVAAGSTITITDSSGNTIIEYTGTKAWQSSMISSPSLVLNSSYTLAVNGTTISTFTISSIITYIGSQNTGGGMPGGGGGTGGGGPTGGGPGGGAGAL